MGHNYLKRSQSLTVEQGPEATLLLALAALGLFLVVSKAQAASPSNQAQEKSKFASLLGEEPDEVETYFSKEGSIRYYAFSITAKGKYDEATRIQTFPRFEVWVYEQDAASNEMREIWHEYRLWPDMLGDWTFDGFVNVAGETAPCLRLRAFSGGNHAGTTRLGLFCISELRPLWVDYYSDYGPSVETGLQKVRVFDDKAPEPRVKQYLLSWGHQAGLDVPPSFPSVDSLRQIQQLWIDANGREACSYENTVPFRWKTWKTDQTDKPTPYTTRALLKDPVIVLDDGQYQWLSYPGADAMANVGTALAGIGRYDKQLGRYDLVYVPDSSFNYSKELVAVGDWLYIQDCNEHWAVRFNTVTHRLQRGDFGAIVGELKTGIYRQGRPSHTSTAQTAMFWTDHRDEAFRHGRFSPAVEEFILTMMRTLPTQAKGVKCDFGRHTGGCLSDSGAAIDLVTNRDKGTQELDVIGASVPPQGEGPFEDLAQIALLYVNRPAWKGYVVPGVARLKVKFSNVGLGVSMLRHYGEGYEVDLAVMDKGTYTMIGAAMGMMGDLGETWEQTWMQKAKLLPDCNFWSLSIIPEGR